MSKWYVPINGYIVVDANSESESYLKAMLLVKFEAEDYYFSTGLATNLDECDDEDE